MASRDEMVKRFRQKQTARKRKKTTPLMESMKKRAKDKAKADAVEPGKEKAKYTRPGGKYTAAVDDDGDPDAVLDFSKKYKGSRVSEMAASGGEPAGFLHWILDQDKKEREAGEPGFKASLTKIIRVQLRKH